MLLVSVLFRRPLTFIIAVGGVGGRGGVKMALAKINQLMSPQGHHFSTHSTAKTNNKSTNLTSIGISDVVTTSVYLEKSRLKELMMMMMKMITIIICIINK